MKYFANKIQYDNHTFDSKTERDRYIYLKNELKEGRIKELELQREFEILPQQTRVEYVQLKTKVKKVVRVDEKAVKYHCDFFYYNAVTGKYIIEEVKSPMTAKIRDYPLRRKLVKMMVKKMNDTCGAELFQFYEIIIDTSKRTLTQRKYVRGQKRTK